MLSPQRSRLKPMAIHEGLMMHKLATRQVFLRIPQCSIITVIPSMFHIHILFIKHKRCIIIANVSATNTESLRIIKYCTQDKYYNVYITGYCIKYGWKSTKAVVCALKLYRDLPLLISHFFLVS